MIRDFETFCTEIGKRYTQFNVYKDGTDLTISLTDTVGRKVVQFIHFKNVSSPFGFLYLVTGKEWR